MSIMMESVKSMTPKEASDEYIRLEKVYNELGERIKVSTRTFQTKMRKERKEIRDKQNMLYVVLNAEPGLARYTEECLGLTNYHNLYKRWRHRRFR